MKDHVVKILFIIPYPLGIAPSQRFRFEQFLKLLESNNTMVHISPYLDTETTAFIYSERNFYPKLIAIVKGIIKRLTDLLRAGSYNYIFIHRETSPIGPPIFEWCISRILRKKIIYDFDDAIWLNDPNENYITSLIKFKSKVRYICKWSWKISCGNEFLTAFALKYNQAVYTIPTVVNTEIHTPSTGRKQERPLIIGWTGTHSTLIYLEAIMPVLRQLHQKHEFKFRIIANRAPDFQDSFIEFVQWNKHTEVQDLQHIDIGLMPLTDDKWSEGKCGFKIIQYLALEIPAVASPVGVNKKLITNNETGFLCNTEEEWYQSLTTLISNPELRARMGKTGREKIIREYSKSATADVFVSLFRE